MSASGSELTESGPCESLYLQSNVNEKKYIMGPPEAIRQLNKVVSCFAPNSQSSAL